MNLWQKIKYWWNDPVDDILDVIASEEDILPVSTGRVITQTRPPSYAVHEGHGGRVVRAMPRSLRKMKEAQND